MSAITPSISMRPSGVRRGRARSKTQRTSPSGRTMRYSTSIASPFAMRSCDAQNVGEVVGVHGRLPLVVQLLERDGAPEGAEDAGARVERAAEVALDACDVGVDVLVDRLDHVGEPRARLGEREGGLPPCGHVDQDPVDGHDAVLRLARVRPVEHHALLAVRARQPVLALERVSGEQARPALEHERAVVGMDAGAPRVDRRVRRGRGVDQRLEAR